MNKLTVITYVHRNEQNLDRCIKGLLEQKTEFNWIVLCYKKIENLPKTIPIDQLILKEEITNKAAAYNWILPQIQSEFIAYNDTDDISLSQRFEMQMAYLEQHPSIDILGTGLIIDDSYQGWDVFTEDNQIKAFMLINNPMVNSSVMLRNKSGIWGKKVRYDESLDRAEDYQFWLDCAKQNLGMANLTTPLISYKTNAKRSANDTELVLSRSIREKAFGLFDLNFNELDLNAAYHTFAEKASTRSSNKVKFEHILIRNHPNKSLMKSVLKRHRKRSTIWSRIKHRIIG